MLSLRHVLRVGLVVGLLAIPLFALVDSDGDGISDVWSALYPTAGTPDDDPDGDGAVTSSEAIAGTDPTDHSSRFVALPQLDASDSLVLRWPGISGKHYRIESTADLQLWTALPDEFIGDGVELTAIIRPAGVIGETRQFWRVLAFDFDSDGDGLNDWEEAQLGTDPHMTDTDGDGLTDAVELARGTDPLRFSSVGDGISDGWKVNHGFDPKSPSVGSEDPDGDGRTNQVEYAMGSNPNDFFNGEAPALAVVSGAEQTPVNGFLALPIVVQVSHPNGQPWPNAPVALDVDFGPGLWAGAVDQKPNRQLLVRAGPDGRIAGYYSFLMPDPAAPAGDIAVASTGPATNPTRLQFLPTRAPVGTWDVWQEEYLFSSRVVRVDDSPIGFQDLAMLPYPNPPQRGAQIRTYRKRDTHLHYSAVYENGHFSDDQLISVQQGEDGKYNVAGRTSFASVAEGSSTIGHGQLLSTMALETNDYMPQSKLVISGNVEFDGVAFLERGAFPTPYGSYCREADYRYLPSRFPEAPSPWSLEHAKLTDSNGNTFEITLSEEDTVADLRARFARSKAVADAVAALPMGTEWDVSYGGFPYWKSDRGAPDYPVIDLVNLERFSDLAPQAEYGRAEFQVRIPEDSYSRVAGAALRARFVVLFYPDEAPDFPEVVDYQECVLSADNNWESPIYSITPETQGYTTMQAWSMTVESARPRRLVPASTQPSANCPAEYANTRPAFAWEAMIPDPEEDGPWRLALKDSQTLQQVFLRDDYYSATLEDIETAATWAMVPGATAQARLWRWHDDGSALGAWSLLPEGSDLKPYFHSQTDYLFIETLASGRAAVRFTTTIDDVSVYDDIRIDADIAPPVLAVDADRDGTIKLPSEDASDETSADKPFRFWLNDDNDASMVPGDAGSEVVTNPSKDYLRNAAGCQRDLEDFARLWISTQGLNTAFKNRDMFLGLKWEVTSGAPAIKVFPAVETDGGDAYLKEASSGGAAERQTQQYALIDERYAAEAPNDSTHTTVGGTDVFVLPKTLFENLSETQPKTFLLFEGCTAGKGQLKLVILDKNKQVIGEGPGVWLELCNIKSMYARTHTTPTAAAFTPPYKSDHPSYLYEIEADGALRVKDENMGFEKGDGDEAVGGDGEPMLYPFAPAWDEDKGKCVVFVHGISLTVDAIRSYSESFVKRLWWEGFRGRFVMLRWGTPIGTDIDQLQVNEGPWVFSDGEMRSWAYGNSLKKLVANLRTQLGDSGVISVAGHSLGNACVGSALRQGMVIDNYVLLEAAVPMMCYHAPAADPQNDPLRAHYLSNLLDAEEPGTIKTTFENYTELGYRGFLQGIAANVNGRIVNYHNRSDYWLATGDKVFGIWSVDWVTWQRKYKPFKISWAIDLDDYCYAGWNEVIRSSTLRTLRPVRSPYEAMPFIARSRTRAVGGEPAPDDYGNGDRDDYREGGPAGYPLTLRGLRIDLKAVYGFGTAQKDHSGQFLRNIQEMYSKPDGTRFQKAFYRQLMEDLDVVP